MKVLLFLLLLNITLFLAYGTYKLGELALQHPDVGAFLILSIAALLTVMVGIAAWCFLKEDWEDIF